MIIGFCNFYGLPIALRTDEDYIDSVNIMMYMQRVYRDCHIAKIKCYGFGNSDCMHKLYEAEANNA